MKVSKNISGFHRAARVILGAVVACAGFYYTKMPWLACVLIGGGGLSLSGLVGYCPVCGTRKDRV